MDIKIRTAESLDEALAVAGAIDRFAAEVSTDFRDQPPAPGLGRRLLERHFDAPQTVVASAIAEDGQGEPRDGAVGFCITVPFEDPLLGDVVPFVAVLAVDSSFRHRGLAGHLMRSVSETLAGRDIHALASRAGHNDDALISMGERWGFTRQWEWMVRE